MSAAGWTPKRGDLVVALPLPAPWAARTDGKTVVVVGPQVPGWLVSLSPGGAQGWVYKVRPATPEEQAAYWLEHGGEA